MTDDELLGSLNNALTLDLARRKLRLLNALLDDVASKDGDCARRDYDDITRCIDYLEDYIDELEHVGGPHPFAVSTP